MNVARDPHALAEWYRDHLGIPLIDGPTPNALFASKTPDATGAPAQLVWAAFPTDTTYFGPGSRPLMLNYRVADLDAMLAQLRAAGVQVEDRTESSEFGRFGWATDGEGKGGI